MDKNDKSRELTTSDAAEYLGVAESTIRAWIKQGKLAARLLGSRYRIKIADLDKMSQQVNEKNPS